MVFIKRPLTKWALAGALAAALKTDVVNEVFTLLAISPHRIRRKAVVWITHGDAGHDDLIIGNARHFADDVRTHNALAIDH